MEEMVGSQTILDAFKGKKVLVTGHTGFKGSWMIEILKQSGAEIAGLALAPDDEDNLFDALEGNSIVTQHHIQDIRDAEATQNIITAFAPDFIFHLAAQPLVLRSYEEPAYTYEVNLMGTIHVLEAIRKLDNPCSSVLITTDKVYENLETHRAYLESDKLGGYDPYSSSKATCEIAIASYKSSFFSEQEAKKIASARAGNVIGGGDMATHRLIPDIYRYLRYDDLLDIRHPDAIRPWQHVLEPVWAYLYMAYLMYEQNLKIDSLNIGPRRSDMLQVKEVVELFLEGITHQEKIQWGVPSHRHEAGILMLDIEKANQIMGWTPILDAKEAIRWTADWYLSEEDATTKTDNQILKYLKLWDKKAKKT